MTTVEIFRQLRSSFAPKMVIAGVIAGFGLMCLLGRQAAKRDDHPGFLRFYRSMSPEWKYYPTINEMMAIVRTKAKPDQILVIVGGNSVMRGVGQPPDQVWTNYLQKELGDGYCVINFAFNGSGITDGGAVLAEALRKEYPRQIYMANAAPTQAPIPDGTNEYRFMFWDAHEKGLLIDDPARNAEIAKYHKTFPYSEGADELVLRSKLDRWFYFQDFWNDFTFTTANTVWGFYLTPGLTSFLQPRKDYRDPEPDFLAMPMSSRYIETNLPIEMINVRGCSEYAFAKDAAGKWQPTESVWNQFMAMNHATFPPELKKRSLILMSRNSPFYIRRLTPDEQERDDLAYVYAVQKWKESGVDSMDYGKDFTIDDYGDRTHLTWHGGVKLSKLVAAKVREMSQGLGYLPAK